MTTTTVTEPNVTEPSVVIDDAIPKPSISPYKHHVLFCTGPRCGENGAAQALYDSLWGKFTAAGICAAVDLFREGRLPQQGFIRQEQVELPAFLANRFGSAYQQSRQVESIG